MSQQPASVRLPTQCEEQINCAASITDFLRRRPAAKHIAKILDKEELTDDIAIHVINRDEKERYIVLVYQNKIRVFDLEGKEKTVNSTASSYLPASDIRNSLKFLTINDYTFIANTKKTVAMLPDKTPTRTKEALFFIKQASYNTTYTLILDGSSYSFTTLDGVAPADEPADELSSEQILQEITNQIPDGFNIEVKGSTMWIRKSGGEDFDIEATDTRSNTHTSVCKERVQKFSDLLLVAPHGYIVEITGNDDTGFDNYFVKFEANDGEGAFGRGVWVETVKPGIQYKLDPATMPHTLIREADGTFSFKEAEWGERTCGDEDTAPEPSFVGRQINDIFFYRNRLSFLSWENLIMSRTGEFFNFFISTATTLVDNDPIDVAASHTKPSNLQHAVAFQGGLLLFTDSTQFALEHDSVLANSTVSIRPVTEFEVDTKAAPISSGKTVFFPTRKGNFSGIREYYTMPDNSDQNDASDVTAHIPKYIKGRVVEQTCSTNEDILFIHTDTDPTAIYVYKYFWNGSEKTQSCWGKWIFSGKVLSSACMNTTLYIVTRYENDGLYIESLNFESGYKDLDYPFEFCLDRKIDEKFVTSVTYDDVNQTTSFTVPYELEEGADIIVVSRQDPIGVLWEVVSVNGNTITVKGNRVIEENTLSPCFIGIAYLTTYTFSPFYLRDANQGSALLDGRLQLRRLLVNCSETGYLEAVVAPLFRTSSVYKFTGRELGHGSNILGDVALHSTTVHIPMFSKNDQVTCTVQSKSYLPFALVNATWEGFYNTRSKRR